MKTTNYIIAILLLILGIQIQLKAADDIPGSEKKMVVDLRGTWKFEIGDHEKWSKADFDHNSWENIFVPSSWEDEGFPGYDGYAWYRKTFQLNMSANTKMPDILYLDMGFVDDVDEVYLNGKLIGMNGQFPPYFTTAYNSHREYRIPPSYLNIDGNNVIAVRIYDEQLAGGIIKGKIGIFGENYPMEIAVPLEGIWNFRTEDYTDRKMSNKSGWSDVFVPGFWEVQGFREYDGFALYQRDFFLPNELEGERLILLLGKIDDIDEAFVNGEKIGNTGDIEDPSPSIHGDEYRAQRAYYLPENKLKFGETNTITVRVYDGLLDGGIYSGPVCIVTRSEYEVWKETVKTFEREDFSIWRLFHYIIKGD